MARILEPGPLIVASHNPGKIREISDLLLPFGMAVQSAGSLDLPEPEETEATFIGNALLKARAAAQTAKRPAIADDSGLAVTALDGAPGIYSARWAGPNKDFGIAMEKVERALIGKTDRTAAFICALALAWPDGHEEVFEGKVSGDLVWPPRGERGFGYDPVFVPSGASLTYGEIDPAEKHATSHRADAFRQLVAACLTRQES